MRGRRYYLRREESKDEYNLGFVRSAKIEEGGLPSFCLCFSGLVRGKREKLSLVFLCVDN